jgi:hypothetical protein
VPGAPASPAASLDNSVTSLEKLITGQVNIRFTVFAGAIAHTEHEYGQYLRRNAIIALSAAPREPRREATLVSTVPLNKVLVL